MRPLPKTAAEFQDFMTYIWGNNSSFDEYAHYHDAITTARLCGMARTGGGRNTETYRFHGHPDGVTIARTGFGCWPANRFSPKAASLPNP